MKTNKILSVVAVVALAGFALVPIRNAAMENEVKNGRLFIQKQQQIARIAELEKTDIKSGTLGSIPNTPQQIEFVNDLTRIAKKTGISIPDSWSFSLGHSSEVDAERLSVGFSISGKRAQIQNFLHEVETNPRFMGVKDFSIATDSTRSIPRTEMSVEVYSFFVNAE